MADTSLSQEEINALFSQAEAGGGVGGGGDGGGLEPNEIDTIGEVANISMGTAATTLFSLVNKKVDISTPVVSASVWDDIVGMYEKPCVLVKISYTKGLNGSNILVLKENDVKVITDLMMGGDGTNTDGEIGELHLSAISEAMNQMMGSSATSLSSMLNMMVDISPPTSDLIDLAESVDGSEIDAFLKYPFVKIEFNMTIGDLVDSKIMQLYPIALAKEMCQSVMSNMESDSASTVDDSAFDSAPAPAPAAAAPPPQAAPAAAPPPQAAAPPPMMAMPQMQMAPQPQVNVEAATFTPFNQGILAGYSQENI